MNLLSVSIHLKRESPKYYHIYPNTWTVYAWAKISAADKTLS